MQDLLVVDDVHVNYHTEKGPVRAAQGVSFTLQPGERLGLVGESGSGKSTIALALMRMIRPPGRVDQGRIVLDGVDLLQLSEEEMRKARLAKISMVAQGAMNSLNPVKRIQDQFDFIFRDHGAGLSAAEMVERTGDLLEQVGLKRSVARMYSHELSGGMKQRVCIATAISLKPKLIIADEPTSALDVVVQWQVIDTLKRVQADLGAAVVQIGHDMGLMAHSVNRLGVMYAGELVELGTIDEIFSDPQHPYTRALIAALPPRDRKVKLVGIPGLPPSLLNRDNGSCPFAPRCHFATDLCRTERPVARELTPGHRVVCHHAVAGAGVVESVAGGAR